MDAEMVGVALATCGALQLAVLMLLFLLDPVIPHFPELPKVELMAWSRKPTESIKSKAHRKCSICLSVRTFDVCQRG